MVFPGAAAWEEHLKHALSSDLQAQPGLCIGSVIIRKQQVQ